VEVLLAEDLSNAYRGWCACGWVSPPYIDIEMAQLDCWQHSFSNRVSDMRVDLAEVSSNGHREAI
jgi:hypothetical protein